MLTLLGAVTSSCSMYLTDGEAHFNVYMCTRGKKYLRLWSLMQYKCLFALKPPFTLFFILYAYCNCLCLSMQLLYLNSTCVNELLGSSSRPVSLATNKEEDLREEAQLTSKKKRRKKRNVAS